MILDDPRSTAAGEEAGATVAVAPAPADPGWRLGDPMPAMPPGPRASFEVPRERYAVLGLGNRLQGDEALGGLVTERLLSSPEILSALPAASAVAVLDGGTVGLGLIPYLCDLEGLVIVDIINADAEPGTFIDLDGADVLRHDTVMGVHELGAEELLGALLFMDALPRRVRVVGLQPVEISLGLELTRPLALAVPGLIDAIVGHLARWQAEDGVVDVNDPG